MIGLYFSGTGNTAYCIETYIHAYDPNASCYSIEDSNWETAIKEEDTIVLAYPIYYSTLPKIMYDFLHVHHTLWNGKKIFIIVTMGLFSGDGSGCAARILKQYGATILGGIHVKMPDCIGDVKALKKSKEQNRILVEEAQERLIVAAQAHRNGKPKQQGLSFGSLCLGLFGQRLWFGHKTKSYHHQVKIDSSQCIACGTCVQVCPMHQLSLKDGTVTTSNHCTMCYRCVSHCPKQAITLLGKQVYEQSLIKKYTEET